MMTIWASEGPVSFKSILRANPNINRNTLQTVLRKLNETGVIAVCGFGYSGNALTREFKAEVSKEEYFSGFFNPHDRTELVLYLLDRICDEEELDKIGQSLDKRKDDLSPNPGNHRKFSFPAAPETES